MKKCVMWSIYGTSYSEFLRLSLASAEATNNIDKIVFRDENSNFSSSTCALFERQFPSGRASKMAYRYECAADLLDDYDKVLHIDVDALIIKDLEELFESKSLGLSVASETSTDSKHFKNVEKISDKATGVCWAGPLLTEEEKTEYESIPSICMGVWLADKSDASLLRKISRDVSLFEKQGFSGMCQDQHAAVRRLLLDKSWNFSLQDYVSHLGTRINDFSDVQELMSTQTAVIHFAGGVQPSNDKLTRMKMVYDALVSGDKK